MERLAQTGGIDLQRPRVKISAKASAQSAVAFEKVFIKIAPDSRVKVRAVPPMFRNDDGEGVLWRKITQHFNFGTGADSTLACLTAHGDGSTRCPVCLVAKPLKDGTAAEKAVYNKIKANTSWYVPVFVRGQEKSGIKLLKLSITSVNKIKNQLNEHEIADDEDEKIPFTGDENGNNGYDFTVIRTGAGLKTEYDVKFHEGQRSNLSDVRADWEDVYNAFDPDEEINLKVKTQEVMVTALKDHYGDTLDLAGLEDEVEA